MGRLLIWSGISLLVLGALMVGLGFLMAAAGARGGRILPGDIVVSRPGFTVYFPIVTSLVLSLLLTLILWAVAASRR
jgi:membrane protein implicated in regulation of membrane protease activity